MYRLNDGAHYYLVRTISAMLTFSLSPYQICIKINVEWKYSWHSYLAPCRYWHKQINVSVSSVIYKIYERRKPMLAVYCVNIKCNGDSLIILPFRRRNDMVVFKNRIFSILAFSSSHQCFLYIRYTMTK